MARICNSDRLETSEFSRMQNRTNAHNENKDCSVKALAVACDVSYEDAHDALALLGRKSRSGVRNDIIIRACRILGCKTEKIDASAIIAEYPKAHRILKSITTHHPKRFAKVWADKPPMLIFTNNHVSAFKDGELHDWAVGRALRASSIFKVVKA